MVKRFAPCYVEHEYDAVSAEVVRACQRAEPLLSSCIPQGQLNALAHDGHVLDLEIDASRARNVIEENVVNEGQHDARFSDTRIASEQEF